MKLDWLKEIIGDGYTEEMDASVCKALGERLVSRADFNTKNEELKTANTTITALQAAAKQYEGVDVAGLRQQIEDTRTEYEGKLSALKKNSAIDLALTARKVRDPRAARAMLDMDKVTMGEDGALSGLDDQLEALQKDDSWLFAGGTTVNTGGEHGEGGSGDRSGVEAAFAALNPGLNF